MSSVLATRALQHAVRGGIGGLVLLASAACGSDQASGGSTQAPAPETLFDAPQGPTPGKLRGVWQNTRQETNATIELRLLFTDRWVVGAARCSAPNGPTVIAGSSTGLDTTALNAAEGKLTFAGLGFAKDENDLHCEASLPGNTYDFKIADGQLSFTVGDARVNTTFTKVSD